MSYPWKSISPKDSLVLSKSSVLTDADTHTLVALYQPLIGVEAISLYLLLKEYLIDKANQELILADLLALLSMDVQAYYNARIKLEAYGLLKVFQSHTDETHFALVLQSPLSAEQFFADPMMKMILIDKVGQRLAEELKERLCIAPSDFSGYKDITKSFLDVVHIDISNYSEFAIINNQDSSRQNEKVSDEMVKNSTFDWGFFMAGLNKQYINTKSMTKDIKKTILTFHLLYGIDELEMQKIVLEATDMRSGNIEEKQLNTLVHKKFLNKPKIKDQARISEEGTSKRIKQLKQKGFSKEEIEIILHADTTQPYNYLKSIKQQKGGFVTSTETWILKELVGNAPLSTSVINILLNYLLIIKDAPTLEKNLATKIANDWAQSKVNSPEDAMVKVKQLYASFNQPKEKKSKTTYNQSYKKGSHARKETLPAWATETAESDQRLSSEEEESYKEKLKKIRNMKSGE